MSAAGTLALAGAVPSIANGQQAATAAPSLVFDGVTVVDVKRGKLLPDQRVVIGGNRVQALGKASGVKLPPGAQVVQARGKYLIPGLWDLHVHPGALAPLFYPMFLANGVTGIRDAGSPVSLDTLIQWRREIVAGTRVGPPRQILSGHSIAEMEGLGESGKCDRDELHRAQRLQTCVADSADARHLVDSLKAAGADMIKPRMVSEAMYYVIAAEARRVGIPFGGHTQEEDAIEASDSGARIFDHEDNVCAPTFKKSWYCFRERLTPATAVAGWRPIAERFRRNGTWLVPTMIVGDERLTAFARRFWADSVPPGNWLRDPAWTWGGAAGGVIDSVGGMHIMQRVGMPILAGTDATNMNAPSGFSLHAELALYVSRGLTPLNALQSATLNPAKLLHATDSLGTVAAGNLADLVLLDADPLVDITHTTLIRAVVANGRYYDRAALDQLLADARAEAKKLPPRGR